VNLPDFTQETVQVFDDAGVHGQYLSVTVTHDHGGCAGLSQDLPGHAQRIGKERKGNAKFFLVGLSLVCFVTGRDTDEFDVPFQFRIIFNDVVQPVHDRRALVASRSERPEDLDADHLC